MEANLAAVSLKRWNERTFLPHGRVHQANVCSRSSAVPSAPPQNLTLEVQNSKVRRPTSAPTQTETLSRPFAVVTATTGELFSLPPLATNALLSCALNVCSTAAPPNPLTAPRAPADVRWTDPEPAAQELFAQFGGLPVAQPVGRVCAPSSILSSAGGRPVRRLYHHHHSPFLRVLAGSAHTNGYRKH